jgi:hypothetical protein
MRVRAIEECKYVNCVYSSGIHTCNIVSASVPNRLERPPPPMNAKDTSGPYPFPFSASLLRFKPCDALHGSLSSLTSLPRKIVWCLVSSHLTYRTLHSEGALPWNATLGNVFGHILRALNASGLYSKCTWFEYWRGQRLYQLFLLFTLALKQMPRDYREISHDRFLPPPTQLTLRNHLFSFDSNSLCSSYSVVK